MLDSAGHVVHIDFGYLLTSAPGGVQFETAPFKFTTEFADVLGGQASELFQLYRDACVHAFWEARKRRDQIIVLVEMTMCANATLPCFVRGPAAVRAELDARFLPGASKRKCALFMNALIDA